MQSESGESCSAPSCSHGGRSWFVKLRGPAELVGSQQAAFEAFVRSLRFGAAPGAKP